MSPAPTTSADRLCTLSVVSHGHAPLVERLIADLFDTGSAAIAEVVVTRNIPGESIRLPVGLGFPVRFVDNSRPRGFAANHNAALAECRTPWLAVLNPDLRVASDPFCPMLAAAQPDSALLVPRVLQSDGSEADSSRLLPTPLRLLRRHLASLHSTDKPSGRAEWHAGMFMLLRTDALRSVGGFDERFFLYCEDVDLCARLRLSGLALQKVQSVSVVHDAQRASRRSPRHLRLHVASLARLWTTAAFWRYRALLAAEKRVAAPAHGVAEN